MSDESLILNQNNMCLPPCARGRYREMERGREGENGETERMSLSVFVCNYLPEREIGFW
jgi:hypothetical protein